MLPKDTVADGWPIVGLPTSLGHDLVQRQIDWRARSSGPPGWAGAREANARGGAKLSTAYLRECPGGGYGCLVVWAADCSADRVGRFRRSEQRGRSWVGERVGGVR